MIAWGVGRGVRRVAKACGASASDARDYGLAAGLALTPIDPVGAAANTAHMIAEEEAEKGSDVGDVVNKGMSFFLLGDVLSDVPDYLPDGK